MEFCIRNLLNASEFPHGPMPHALGHLWGEGQKYVSKIAYFLVHSFIVPAISVREPMFSDLECFPHLCTCLYIKNLKKKKERKKKT